VLVPMLLPYASIEANLKNFCTGNFVDFTCADAWQARHQFYESKLSFLTYVVASSKVNRFD